MQIGWIWDGRRWTHEEILELARTYPDDFPYTPQTVEKMFVQEERDYISPTMLSDCPRAIVLKQQSDYWVPLEYAYAAYRGTMIHAFLDDGTQEDDALVERAIRITYEIPGGGWMYLRGKPDKVIPGQKLLIDYKSIKDDDVGKKKPYWVPQLSVYRYMLAQPHEFMHECPDGEALETWETEGPIEVTRALIQQFSMKRPHRTALELWPLGQTKEYLDARISKFVGVFDGTYDVDELLPPVLDAELDSDSVWKCTGWRGKAPWCPVAGLCAQIAREGR